MGPNERQKLEWLLGIRNEDLEKAEKKYSHINVLKFLHALAELQKLVCKRVLTLENYFQATSLLEVIKAGVSFKCGCKECSSYDREVLSSERQRFLKNGESFNLLKERFLASGVREELEEDLAYELIKKTNTSDERTLKQIAKTFASTQPVLCVLNSNKEKYWLLAEDTRKNLYLLPGAVAAMMVAEIKELENAKDLQTWQIETIVSLLSPSFSLEKAVSSAKSL